MRVQMERTFGSDFDGVRVHTDSEAHLLNRAVNVVAFTTGQDIFFRQSAYSPSSSAGNELLAHELTHVVQQAGSSAFQEKLVPGGAADSYGQGAGTVAKRVATALDGSAGAGPIGSIQRRCACGGHSAGEGECAERRHKREHAHKSGVAMQGSPRELQRQADAQDDCSAQADAAQKKCQSTASTYCNRIQTLARVAGAGLGGAVGFLGGGVGAGVGALAGGAIGYWLTADCPEKVSQRCETNYQAAKQKCAQASPSDSPSGAPSSTSSGAQQKIPVVNVEDLPKAIPDVNVVEIPKAQSQWKT
jgi:hypothetical protein